MPAHALKAFLATILLVPLAWAGIALGHRLEGTTLLITMLVWGLVFAGVATFAVYFATRSRDHRMARRPEPPSRLR